MDDRVTLSVEGGVADVRLARADKMNACDPGMFAALVAMQERVAAMREVRCVVLSGEGRAFSVGLDISGLRNRPERDLKARTHGIANAVQQAAYGWRTLPQPVIAAVHGFAFGAGLQIMLGADVRIAAPDTQLSIMEGRWGLVPDLAGVALLRTLVRDDVARELTYTARRFSGEEAARLGVVSHVAEDPHAEALALARQIAAASPDAVRAAKRLFNLAADADTAEILMAESVEQGPLLKSANHRETVAAAAEKRTPVFQD